ncbi:hypothetical protein TNCV_4202541 [Trichonephila clavipes]|uniref:Uncharacterized protein n=1 Tax=Trichonephila clavipes TaxID=2585209 RepID=A0A8X6V6T1_TRICX|nr:hypothetical protein TNCV_4202531 [Trichonephila clavipes]GFY06983.1 hypothetical protein TNCV_4202541 [Trichonephila clavipes]
MPLSRRGNVSPFARVRPQRWGKKDAFHQIPFLVNSKNRAIVKMAVVTLGTGDLPSLLPSFKLKTHKKHVFNARREFVVNGQEGCGSSVMPVVLSRSPRLVRDACSFIGGSTSPTKSAKLQNKKLCLPGKPY